VSKAARMPVRALCDGTTWIQSIDNCRIDYKKLEYAAFLGMLFVRKLIHGGRLMGRMQWKAYLLQSSKNALIAKKQIAASLSGWGST